LFDTKLINRITDLSEDAKARLQILNLDVGSTVSNESSLSVMIMAHSDKELAAVVAEIEKAALQAKVSFRQAGSVLASKSEGQSHQKSPIKVTHSAPQKKVLLLGSGFVARPLVEYLIRRPENALTVASLNRSEVDALIGAVGGSGPGSVLPQVVDLAAAESGVSDASSHLEALVKNSDLVVSLAPASLHLGVARLAVRHGVHMVTASYVSPAMQALDSEAKAKDVLLLNEVGLDPGIDHLSAMKMIDEARSQPGNRILRFSSVCGGLTAPEAAGANPIGYKFSWSPRGALIAAQNPARFVQNGVLQEIPGHDLLAHGSPLTINNALALDVLPNRDSTQFAELYGLSDIPTFFRGTLRYRGFCERMLALARLGLLDPSAREELQAANPSWTRRRWLAHILGAGSSAEALADQPAALWAAVRTRLIALASESTSVEVAESQAEAGLDFLGWMGFFGDDLLPASVPLNQPVDVTASLLQRPETAFQPGERDMVVMSHELDVERADGSLQRHVATLIDYGVPNGATSMAKTVGVTAAICSQLILDGPGRFGYGVQRPLRPSYYEPVLKLLEAEGIRMDERVETLRQGQSGRR